MWKMSLSIESKTVLSTIDVFFRFWRWWSINNNFFFLLDKNILVGLQLHLFFFQKYFADLLKKLTFVNWVANIFLIGLVVMKAYCVPGKTLCSLIDLLKVVCTRSLLIYDHNRIVVRSDPILSLYYTKMVSDCGQCRRNALLIFPVFKLEADWQFLDSVNTMSFAPFRKKQPYLNQLSVAKLTRRIFFVDKTLFYVLYLCNGDNTIKAYRR